MYKNILLPTDGSELSAKAIKNGIALAKILKAKVTGVHVVSPRPVVPTDEFGAYDPQMQLRLEEAAHKSGEMYLNRIEAEARNAGVDFERVLVEHEQPWKGIIEPPRNISAI